METLRTTQSYVESTINYSLANPYIMAIVKVGLALYAAQIAHKTPEYLQVWFQNTVFPIFYQHVEQASTLLKRNW